MTNDLKFSVIYNGKYLFLAQVHIISYWLDAVVLLQTAGWVSSTYVFILEPKLKRKPSAQHPFLMAESTELGGFCNLAIPLKASVWKWHIVNILLGKASQMSKPKVNGHRETFYSQRRREWIIIYNNINYHSTVHFCFHGIQLLFSNNWSRRWIIKKGKGAREYFIKCQKKKKFRQELLWAFRES